MAVDTTLDGAGVFGADADAAADGCLPRLVVNLLPVFGHTLGLAPHDKQAITAFGYLVGGAWVRSDDGGNAREEYAHVYVN